MSTNTRRPFTVEDSLCINGFADRAPVRLSSDGRFLAYTVEDRSGEAVQEQVWVTDVNTGETRRVLHAAAGAYFSDWSPVGPVFAFVADTGEGPRLWTHNVETGETVLVSSLPMTCYPPGVRFYPPQWLPDGSAVICTIASRVGQPGYDHLGQRVSRKAALEEDVTCTGVTVRCWESPPVSKVTIEAEDCESASANFCGWNTLARVDQSSGTVTALVEDIGIAGWTVSPDGDYVAFLRYIGRNNGENTYQLCVVESSGGEVRVLDPEVTEEWAISLSWSPDSTRVAYCPGHEVAVVGLDSPGPRVLTSLGQGLDDEFYEAPLWSPDGTYLLVTRNASVWRVPVDGGEPIDLLPDRWPLYARGIAAPDGGPVLWSPDGESVIIEMRNRDTGELGLARVSLSGAGILNTAMSMQTLSDVPRFHLDVSPARGLITFVRESATCPQDVWVTDASLYSPRRVTNLNPHVDESQFSTPRLISWTGPDGTQHRSAYYPPVGDPEGPHPVVLVVYEGSQSSRLSFFGYNPVLNIQLLTNHGYGVCAPDQVCMSWDNQAEALRGMLACAVQSLISEGIADPARVGILGHSFGGYITNVAITGLDCFAAAVTSAGMANYTSVYGTPGPSGDVSKSLFVESGQPHMGVPPWEDPQRYIDNSPLFALDKVTTPVLIAHGDQDDMISQAWELFNGLRRLNKPAALAIYQGEDHAQCDWRRPNVIDFWGRVLGWFDKYMGEER